MATYVNSSRRTPCPVCGKDHGCRLFQDGKVWCLRAFSEGDVPQGYRFLGELRGGLGGSVIPDSGIAESRPVTRVLSPRRRKDISEVIRPPLPIAERDIGIRRLVDEIGLTTSDRRYLTEVRRLTDRQIARGLYCSLRPYQPLPSGIPGTFPGANRGGTRLLNRRPGIAGALFDPQGRAVGMQIRLRTNDGSKYRWLRGDRNSSHLPNGELPLTFVRPDRIVRARPALVEGTTFKPQLAADIIGQIAIGASGGQHAGSPLQLRRYLDEASRELQSGNVIDIYPDGGDILNPYVMRRWSYLYSLLASWGFSIAVAWWGQTHKGAQDVDELSSSDALRYLSWEGFLSLSQAIACQRIECPTPLPPPPIGTFHSGA